MHDDIRLRQQSTYVKNLKAEEMPESFKNITVPKVPKPSIKDIISKVRTDKIMLG
jgi:hypothetical protein